MCHVSSNSPSQLLKFCSMMIFWQLIFPHQLFIFPHYLEICVVKNTKYPSLFSFILSLLFRFSLSSHFTLQSFLHFTRCRRLWSKKLGRTRCSWPHHPLPSLPLSNQGSIRRRRSWFLRLHQCSLHLSNLISLFSPPMTLLPGSLRMLSPKCRMVCGFSWIFSFFASF